MAEVKNVTPADELSERPPRPGPAPDRYKPTLEDALTVLGLCGITPLGTNKFDVKLDVLCEAIGPTMRERLANWLAQKYDLVSIRTAPAAPGVGNLIAGAKPAKPFDSPGKNRGRGETQRRR